MGLRCLFYVVILIIFVCFEMSGQDEPVIPNDMVGNNCASIPVSQFHALFKSAFIYNFLLALRF